MRWLRTYTKSLQRILAQSIAREAGPKGIHVAYITIDAVIDLRWTRKRYPEKSDDFFIRPDEIADEAPRHVVHQSRGAWSFDVENTTARRNVVNFREQVMEIGKKQKKRSVQQIWSKDGKTVMR